MPKYRKKPVIIEAVQLKRTEQSILKAEQFLEGKDNIGHYGSDMAEDRWDEYVKSLLLSEGRYIQSREGALLASWNDWIIKGYSKEAGIHFWVCKSDYFESAYDLMEDQETDWLSLYEMGDKIKDRPISPAQARYNDIH